jgi:outer membrane protein assembly factor BamD (BamD/ComL family)
MKFMVYVFPCMILFLASCSKMTEDELWKKAEQVRAGGNADSTILLCQTILNDYPQGKEAAHALYMLAEAYNGKQEYHAAVNYYSAFAAKYPDSSATPVAMFLVGFIYDTNLQMLDSARTAYQNFLTRFPNHELAASAKSEIDNLGKTPDEIIGVSKDLAVKAKKPTKKK